MLKGTDMSLYAVFVKLGLSVCLKPILVDLESPPYESNKYEFMREGNHEPGVVGKMNLIVSDDNENPLDIVNIFGDPLDDDIVWVTKPLWRDLAPIHADVSILPFLPVWETEVAEDID